MTYLESDKQVMCALAVESQLASPTMIKESFMMAQQYMEDPTTVPDHLSGKNQQVKADKRAVSASSATAEQPNRKLLRAEAKSSASSQGRTDAAQSADNVGTKESKGKPRERKGLHQHRCLSQREP